MVRLMTVVLHISGTSFAQFLVQQEDLAEEMLYLDGSEMLPLAHLEEHQELLLQGVEINTASLDELTKSGLFTPFQAQVLLDYRKRFGLLWSVHELDALPGFRGSELERVKPILYISTENPLRNNRGKSGMLMIDAGRTIPLSRGYSLTDPSTEAVPYPGSPWKTSMRLRTRSNRGITLAASMEKDAGERFLYNQRPEYLAGYASLCRSGILREVIAGNFRLGHGLGLVSGSGFMHAPERLSVTRSSLSIMRPSASLSNTRACNGLAAKIETPRLRVLAWSSYREYDLSPDAVRTEAEPFESRRETGLHRTPGETAGRSLGYRFHTGVQALKWFGDLTLGGMAAVGLTGLTTRGTDIAGFVPSPSFFQACSVHWLWNKRNLETFGELACREAGDPAFITGFRYHFSDFLQGLLLLHHYSPGYRGIDPSAYASGSKTENEYGIALSLQAEPGRFLLANYKLEYFRYPGPRYLINIPSWSTRFGVTFQSPGRGSFIWKIRVTGRSWQTTPRQVGLNHCPVVNQNRLRAELRLDHHPTRTFSWLTRIVLSKLTETGFAAVQQFRFTGNRWGTTLQFVVFHIKEWDNRIYLFEPGPLYSFNFPSLCGKGQKVTLQINWKPLERLTLTGKVSHMTYFDRDAVGSGNDLTTGNQKWQTQFQVRLGF